MNTGKIESKPIYQKLSKNTFLHYNWMHAHLPNKVILRILLHCMAKDKSESSKIVTRSWSTMRERPYVIAHCAYLCSKLLD